MTHSDEARTTEHPAPGSTDVTRRVVLRGATVGGVALPLLAACAGGDASGSSPDPAASSGSGGSGGGSTVTTADVPVGGGTLLKDQQVVVTQPSEGDFKAFSAICTHQGCTVTGVAGGEIVCPCHGSHFSIKDGSPVSGPAQSALAAKKVSVEGDQITVA
jgi:Rieske Fe-S protein